MRKTLLLLCVLFVLSSCQSAQEAQQQLQQTAEAQAKQQVKQQVDKAVGAAQAEANKAKDSFFGGISQKIADLGKAIRDWWGSIWGTQPAPSPNPQPNPNPVPNNTTYVVGSNGARGRECPQLTCQIITTFNPGQEIQVSGTKEGDLFGGSTSWLIVSFNDLTVYVHSSLANPKASQPPPQEPPPVGDVPVSVLPIGVPFRTEISSADVEGKGSQNCGPASIAMVLGYFGTIMTTKDAAIEIRKPAPNVNGQDGTDFEGSSSTNLLALHNLSVNTSVTTFLDIQRELRDGHPVIILVNNKQYRKNEPAPYVNDGDSWFVNNHIIVVTGYNAEYVFVNDPLRFESKSLPHPEDYKIPVAIFNTAASTTPQSSATKWYAMSVSRKIN